MLIPGMEGDREFFAHQIEGLSDMAKVIAVDLVERRPSLRTRIFYYAEPLIELLDFLSIDRCVVLGESMGGMVAVEMCLSFPEKIAGLILSNSIYDRRMRSFGFNMPTLATIAHFLAFLPIGEARRKRLLQWVGKNRGFIFDPSDGNRELIDYILNRRNSSNVAALLDRFIAVANTDLSQLLDKINVPTLIIRGEEDMFVGEEVARYLLRNIKNSELAMIKGAGHCAPLTAYEQTNHVIRKWLVNKGFA